VADGVVVLAVREAPRRNSSFFFLTQPNKHLDDAAATKRSTSTYKSGRRRGRKTPEFALAAEERVPGFSAVPGFAGIAMEACRFARIAIGAESRSRGAGRTRNRPGPPRAGRPAGENKKQKRNGGANSYTKRGHARQRTTRWHFPDRSDVTAAHLTRDTVDDAREGRVIHAWMHAYTLDIVFRRE